MPTPKKLNWHLPSGEHSELVDIGPGESQTLDLAFQKEGEEGCWLATEPPQYMPPGTYRINLTVGSDNSGPVIQELELVSPRKGETIQMHEVRKKRNGNNQI